LLPVLAFAACASPLGEFEQSGTESESESESAVDAGPSADGRISDGVVEQPLDGGNEPILFDAGMTEPPDPGLFNAALSEDGSNILLFEGGIYEASAGTYGTANDWPSAVDGDLGTGWYVCTNGWMDCPQTVIEIDLGLDCAAHEISYRLGWDGRAQYGSGATAVVAVSDDRALWRDVDVGQAERSSDYVIDLRDRLVSGRYLRLVWTGAVGADANDWNGWGNLLELQVWCEAQI